MLMFITFDYERGVYYPGQVVSGVFELKLAEPITFSVLYATILGEAKVQWLETETQEVNGHTSCNMIKYVGREEYVKFTQSLAGGPEPTHLPEGSYKYPFSCQLPYNIPSTFSGERGKVEYTVSIQMLHQGRPLFKENQEPTKLFEVVAPFDLNKGRDDVRHPIEMEFEEVNSCSCFCNTQPVRITVRLPVSGYCPGQVMPIAVDVNNKSDIEVSKIIIEFITKECYRTQQPMSEYIPPHKVMTSVKHGAVLSGSKRRLTLPLAVPELVVPNLERCGLIDVGYFLKITIKLSGCNEDLVDEAEICLGLVPLTETVEGDYVHPMSHSLPQGPIPEQQNQPIPQYQAPINTQEVFTHLAKDFQQNASLFQNIPSNVTSSSYVEYREEVRSTDPSKNYQIGFKMSSFPGSNAPQITTYNFPNQPLFNSNVSPTAPPLD